MENMFETEKLEVLHMITEMENNPDLLDRATFENEVYHKLNNIREKASKLVMDNLSEDNNFNIMISSGSKGKTINMGQMTGCIGQQAVEGKRIKKKVIGRTLSYYHRDDDSAMARGFVQRAFLNGARWSEFIFVNMSGREGLIDTAIKTAESGYVQRKLIKAMEDVMIKYDGTCRNSNNRVIQFVYGDNGIDTTKQTEHTLTIIRMSNTDIKNTFGFSDEELKKHKWNEKDQAKYLKFIVNARDHLRYIQMCTRFDYKIIVDSFMLPCNFYRIIDNNTGRKTSKDEPITPEYVQNQLERVVSHEEVQLTSMTPDEAVDSKSWKYNDESMVKTLFRYALYEFLAPKRCINEYKFNKEQFDRVITEVIRSYNRAIAEPGEMVGIIAAQSTGEPVTQIIEELSETGGGGFARVQLKDE